MKPLSSIPPHHSPPLVPNEQASSLKEAKTQNEPVKPGQPTESLSISQTGKDLNEYTKAITNLPDIRQERIAKIQAKIEQGTYFVPAQELADKLIQEISSPPPDISTSTD